MGRRKKIGLVVVSILVVMGIIVSLLLSKYMTSEEREQANQQALDTEMGIMLLS